MKEPVVQQMSLGSRKSSNFRASKSRFSPLRCIEWRKVYFHKDRVGIVLLCAMIEHYSATHGRFSVTRVLL
jgi:hypothetical protein